MLIRSALHVFEQVIEQIILPSCTQQTNLINMSDTYKPTEHDGLKQDGTPDQRVGTGGMVNMFDLT
jgi:hypothetical protein